MSDLIERQVAIDAAIEAVDEWDGGCSPTRADMIADAINNTVPSAQTDLIAKIQNGINITNANDSYSCGMLNGMRWCMSLIDDKEPLFENCPPAQPEQRWIPCSERLPENRDWVLGIFQEGDTGWINPIPFICDYVGKKTPITTQDNWLLKLVDEPNPYYERLHCIAWMPLPEPYEGEQE